jgi:peptidoglycan L-alanyl-D-glutamate endopeptidase CwlK
MSHLHPTYRRKAEAVLEGCSKEGLPFKIFEGFRSPQRQQFLYEQGRTRPGNVVTNAEPWRSIHQYGLAADFVLHESGRWSWDTAGEKRNWWSRLHEIGRAQGLEPLGWEAPHLQLSGLPIADLQAGRYPEGGDLSWAECLESAIISWTGMPSSPPAPGFVPGRPPLEAEFVELVGTEDLPPPAAENWHSKFGDLEWRYDAGGVYIADYKNGKEPLCTPGEPTTCRAVWQLFAHPIVAASRKHNLPPALIMMTIATETAFARKAGFTGPLTFRWEPNVRIDDVNPPRLGDYSAGPMQLLATTARWIIREQGLDYEPFVVGPALEYLLDKPDALPLYDPSINIAIGAATIAQRHAKTGDDPILVSAAYNAGGLYRTNQNSWCLKTTGDHLDRAARWYGDACRVLQEL